MFVLLDCLFCTPLQKEHGIKGEPGYPGLPGIPGKFARNHYQGKFECLSSNYWNAFFFRFKQGTASEWTCLLCAFLSILFSFNFLFLKLIKIVSTKDKLRQLTNVQQGALVYVEDEQSLMFKIQNVWKRIMVTHVMPIGRWESHWTFD